MAAFRGPGLARSALVALAVIALAFQIVRSAAVNDRERRPALATALWPSHPDVLTDSSLLAIGKAAARGSTAPAQVRADMRRVAALAPLSADPFLIEGAVAQSEGRGGKAETLLFTARDRDPRSRGTRFLLADRFIRTGRIAAGLIEMHALVSLQSRGAEAFGPALVAYARSPGAIPQLRSFFSEYPQVEENVLAVLANDAANADLVLALATREPSPQPAWHANLVSALVATGQYAKAYRNWARLSRVRADRGLFNPAFAPHGAPPPFNWQFAETTDGVAEPDGKGGLDVLYYGRANAVLASQLLFLALGDYRLSMAVDDTGGEGSLHWTVRCVNDQKKILEMALRAGALAANFRVEESCNAQWLELAGVSSETPRISEMKVRALSLGKEPGR